MSRKRPGTDTPAYAEMMGRLIRTAGRRASTDPAALAALAQIQRDVDEQMRAAVRSLSDAGTSWADITVALGRSSRDRGNVFRKYAAR